MKTVDQAQLLLAARRDALDLAAALRLAASVVDCGGVAGVSDAGAVFRHLLALEPSGVGWAAWGRLLNTAGNVVAARPLLRRATIATPWRAQTWSDYANALQKLKSPRGAAAGERALALLPSDGDYLFNVGCDRHDADRLHNAERLLRWARLINPLQAAVWTRAGALALLRGELARSERRVALALALAPSSAEACNVRGMWLVRRRDRAAAARWWLRAQRVDPGGAEARFNLGLADLEAGRLDQGWRDYEFRFISRGYVEGAFAAPRWRGEPLTRKRLFLWREQGVGDEIMFSSCFADAARVAGGVTVSSDRRLISLFSRSFPTIRFISDRERCGEAYDYHAPIGSLPRVFRSRLRDFSAPGAGWLQPDKALAADWRRRLAELPQGLNVGLAWTSGVRTTERTAAYTALADWGPLFNAPGVNVVNLQYGEREAEIVAAEARFGKPLRRWRDLDLKNDFEHLAALLSALDLVICPATAVGELAAALGACVWRIGAPDWTFLGSAARPWFPAQRLFNLSAGQSPKDVPAIVAAELARLRLGRPPKAAAPDCFDQALARYRQGDLDGAAARCALALRDGALRDGALRDGAPQAWADDARLRHLAAVIANRRGQPEEAFRLLHPLAGRDDLDPAAWSTLGAALKLLGAQALAKDQLRVAEKAFRLAAAIDPSGRAALINLGAVLIKAGKSAAGAQAQGWVLRLDPADAEAWSNYALAYERLGRNDEAETAYRRAIAADPGHATARSNLGLLLLKRGALKEGYAEYDWRFRSPHFKDFAKPSTAPLWRGENLAGKTLLVWREQGLGDEIMFAACYGDLTGRAARVVVQCDRRLIGPLSRSFPQLIFFAEGTAPPPHDAQVPAGTLLRRLRGRLRAFSDTPRFLMVDPALAAFWRARLAAMGPELKVGLAWRSGLITSERRDAYTDLGDWAAALRTPGVRFINLQHGDVRTELASARAALGAEIVSFDDLNLRHDLEGAAALMSALDLVLSPATSAGELAAAVGAPTWRLAAQDWTSLGTQVRPMFPAMRIWSPRAGERLRAVAERIAAALRRLAAAPGDPPQRQENAALRLAAARRAFSEGVVAEAAQGFAGVLRADRQSAPAWVGLGACQAEVGDNVSAEFALTRGTALAPADPAVWTTLGNVLAATGRHGAAERAHMRAIRLAPGFSPAWDNLGVTLMALGRDGEAEACHRRALAGMANAPAVWGNLAAALRSQGRWTAARRALNRALALSPADPGIFAGLTRLLRSTDAESLKSPWLDRALRLAPDFPAIAFNRGLELLRAGELRDGWRGYDRRFDAPELAFAKPDPPGSMWRGENLSGRRLLIWGEQGVGDQILFASVLPDVMARAAREGGRVALGLDPRMGGLLANSFPDADIIADVSRPGRVDYHCGIGSLAGMFRHQLADFPPQAAHYLAPDPALAALWRRRVDALPAGLRVGVAWRSGLLTGERRKEYFELGDLGSLLTAPGIAAINLMYGAETEVAAAKAAGARLFGWPDLDLKNDFSAVAALIVQLDMVIAPAVSVAELSAALGVPTWRLTSNGDWTRLGTAVRPWRPSQMIFTPAPGEDIRSLSRDLAVRLAKLAQQPGDD